jgi:cell volume regulation protein A
MVCLLPFRFSLRELLFIAWVGLRGAVPIFLAIIPVLGGVLGGPVFFNIAFLVVLASLLLQGWSIAWVARLLGVQVPSRPEAESRLEIDLPQQLDRDVIGYRVAAGSRAAGRPLGDIEMPRRARILTVLRDNTVVPRERLTTLEAGDVVLTICPPEESFRLDRQFTQRRRDGRLREDVRLADFVFPADTTLGQLGHEYGLPIAARDEALKLGDWMTVRLGAGISVGDACRLGECALIVVDVAENKVRQVGLRLDAGEEAEFGEGFFEHLRQLHREAQATLRRLGERRRLRRASSRRTKPAQQADVAAADPDGGPGPHPDRNVPAR